MRWFIWLLVPGGLFVALVLMDLGCEHVRAAAAPGPVEVEVHVIDDQTQAPIANAKVFAPGANPPVSTDSAGMVTIKLRVLGGTAWGFFHRRGYYGTAPLSISAPGYHESVVYNPKQTTLTVLGFGTTTPKVTITAPLSRVPTTLQQ